MICLLIANRGSKCSLTRAVDGRIVRYGITSSCQSAATSEIAKALLVLSPSHVRSAIASTEFYLFRRQSNNSFKQSCSAYTSAIDWRTRACFLRYLLYKFTFTYLLTPVHAETLGDERSDSLRSPAVDSQLGLLNSIANKNVKIIH